MVAPDRKRRFDDDSNERPEPRRPLIGIALLPSAATLGNMLCGFMAILCCLLALRDHYYPPVTPRLADHPLLLEFFPTYIAVGCWLIVAAMVCDALDGRLARIARQTSEFGAQLDSIADIVSFGAAPAMMFITMLLIRLGAPIDSPETAPLVSKLLWRVGMLSAIVYVSCGAIRLARYNAENVKDESGQKKFSGLPVPGAAAAVVALIMLHEDLRDPVWGIDWAWYLRWVMAPVIFGIGILMVSRMDYVHVFNVYVRREQPPTHLVWLVVAGIVGLFFIRQITLVALAYTYIVSGIVATVRRRGLKHVQPAEPAHAEN